MSLTVDQLSYAFGDCTILHDISLHIDAGEIVCLVGPSGCGKSTLLNLIAGIYPLQQGSISLNDVTLSTANHHVPIEKRHIGMVFQHPSLFPHLSLQENTLFGVKKGAVKTDITKQLETVGLSDYADHYPHMLSGGQQQRGALARALASSPRMMLLDEPFANLDVVLRKQLRQEMFTLLKEADIPVLMVTHDPEEALAMADRIYVMQHGRIIQSGEAEALYTTPANPFVMHFFGDVNILEYSLNQQHIDTIFGNVPVEQLNDNTQVLLCIRPEGLSLHQDPSPHRCKAEVVDVRFNGPLHQIYVRIDGSNEQLCIENTNLPLPLVQDMVYVECDPKFQFIFPKEAA